MCRTLADVLSGLEPFLLAYSACPFRLRLTEMADRESLEMKYEVSQMGQYT